jgi:YHS domain-containing protein
LALEGYCPVAYFAVNKPVRGVPEFASTHNGVTYHFVNADAKKAFDAEPEKYVPAYGGWCAFGMAVSDKFPVDPTNFKIVDGRLMLFLKNKNVDALKLWNDGNEKDFVKKADAHWKTVTK